MGRSLPWNHRPSQPPAPDVPKHRSSKDTRSWCKGKVGRPHVPVWVQSRIQVHIWSRFVGPREKDAPESEEVCGKCGKSLGGQCYRPMGSFVGHMHRDGRITYEPMTYGPAF